ncbi:MAG: SDR family oxidoreductase [Nisaea sp.]|jgi:NAD(P)-dependent dehydrogenase (short-subunit alcohol dehydrogenase family)|uniref:SDR family oxidoreductase n=1 Tax=Nisaea sp. TaxID=2024842 RepID=UPI001B0EB939|nr:SDR family oxidoreductase [Nisaea sp.]MBO6560774.1 SDR family oxidoreductase [Nisaea sp.]
MKLDLTGKRALITAGAGGIGRRTAELFSQAGAKVFICDIDRDQLEDARDKVPNLDGTLTDVSDRAAQKEMFAAAIDYLGGLDILVNNAGTAGPTAPVEEVSLDDWAACIDINLTSTFLMTQMAVPHLRNAGGGAIINLSSAAGKFGFPMRSPYSAAKWGIVGFTRTIAIELGPDRIRCNAIQPGAVEGARIDRVIKAKAEAKGISENAMRNELASIASLKEFVTSDDIASMILFLCSKAGAHVTGQAISIDAGLEGLV